MISQHLFSGAICPGEFQLRPRIEVVFTKASEGCGGDVQQSWVEGAAGGNASRIL